LGRTLRRMRGNSSLHDANAFKSELSRPGGKVLAVRKELASEVSEADGKLSFTLSTDSVDRSSDVIKQDGWKLDNYRRNPVVLWAHDQGAPPVGKAELVLVENGALRAKDVEFTGRDLYPFGAMVGDMYRKGFLSAVSVGFQPLKFNFNAERGMMAMDFEEQELLEFSAVPVPANPDALMGAKAAGIDLAPLIEWAEKTLDAGEGRASLLIPREYVEKLWATAKPPRAVSVGKAEHDEDDCDEDEKLLSALSALTAALSEQTQALKENSLELRAMRAEVTPKAAPPAPTRKLSGEDIAKRVQEVVSQRISALTGRITE
jgi:HK97 family phage prohead protease